MLPYAAPPWLLEGNRQATKPHGCQARPNLRDWTATPNLGGDAFAGKWTASLWVEWVIDQGGRFWVVGGVRGGIDSGANPPVGRVWDGEPIALG